SYYGDDFLVECPTGSGHMLTLRAIADLLSQQLISLFTRAADGCRPVFGAHARFQTDPHWRDHLLFYEYFHGDTGVGLGASHQTGWTGLAPAFVYLFETLNADRVLEEGLGSFVSAIAVTRASPARRPAIRRKPAPHRG